MDKNKIVAFKKPGDISEDPLTELLRSGARKLITDAVEVELQELLNQYSHHKNGKRLGNHTYPKSFRSAQLCLKKHGGIEWQQKTVNPHRKPKENSGFTILKAAARVRWGSRDTAKKTAWQY